MSWRDVFWGWRGRLNRLQFFVAMVTLSAVMNLLTWRLSLFPVLNSEGEIVVEQSGEWIAHLIAMGIWALFAASVLTRRLHDVGLVASWVIVLWAAGLLMTQWMLVWPNVIPFWARAVFGIPVGVMSLVALIAKSNDGANRFGPQPAPGLPKRL